LLSFAGGDDAIWIDGPDKGPGVVVGLREEPVDGGLEINSGGDGNER
jgi:hypothetical protein